MKGIVCMYGKETEIEFEPTVSIEEIKIKINEINGTPVENINLYVEGHPIKSGVLSDYDVVKDGCKFYVRVKFPKNEEEEKKEKNCIIM